MQTRPDFFLADLPPGTALAPNMITEACLTLRRNRNQYLAGRTTEQMISLLANVAQEWLDEAYPFRQQAIAECEKIGVTKQVLEQGLTAFFSEVTQKNLRALILQDVGHLDRLEKFCSSEIELTNDRASFAKAPELLVQMVLGKFHSEAFLNLTLGLLLRSAQFFVATPGYSTLLRLFAHSIYQIEPKIGACIEIAEWDDQQLDDIIFLNADGLTIAGTERSIADLKRRMPPSLPLATYAAQVSFAYIAREALQGSNPLRLARAAASDISGWNQFGTNSPHIIYVEHGGSIEVSKFAELLSEAMQLREETHPRGNIENPALSAIRARRQFYETRAGSSERTKIWKSPESTAWTVVFEADPLFQQSCLNRFIFVKAVTGITEVIQSAESVRGKIATIALEAGDQRIAELAQHFATWGANRICKLGNMQEPSLLFRRNGRPSLARLVSWVDWEKS